MGRPKLDIDPNQVIKLAELQCTYEEMAAFFGCDKSTLSNRFSTEIAKGREVGKISLRRKQFKLADSNAAMAIFLGKNYLGQRDQREETLTHEFNGKEWAEAIKGIDTNTD